MKPRNPYVRACATRRTRFDDKRVSKLAAIETRDLRMFEGQGWSNLKALREDAREVGMFWDRVDHTEAYLDGFAAGVDGVETEKDEYHQRFHAAYMEGYKLGEAVWRAVVEKAKAEWGGVE